MAFLGIDLGTSFLKGGVLHSESNRVEHVRRIAFPQPVSGTDKRYCEFDPLCVVALTRKLIEELAALASPCQGILMCNQSGSMVLVESPGRPASNLFGWRDQRMLDPHPSGAGSYHQVLRERIGEQYLREMGNELPIGSPISFLFWLAEQGRLKPALTPLSLGDFVLSALCQTAPSIEATNAMGLGLLNLSSLQWHSAVIEKLGFSALRWPELRKQGEIAGYVSLGGSIVPCFTPVGDHQCALLGALVGEDELSLNISTGSQVSRIVPNLVMGNYQTRPFFAGKFTNTITHLPAGRSLNVLVDLLTEIARAQGALGGDPWSYIAAAASASEPSALQVNLGFFPGPAGQQGAITHIDEKTLNVGALFRAAFANMADNYHEAARRVWPDGSWRRLVFSGGLAAKLPLLRELIQERFRREQFRSQARLCPVAEDTLCGLLLLAKVFSGETSSLDQARSELRSRYAVPD